LATRKLLLWFDKKRKSKTLDLAQQQIYLAIDTVSELENVITVFSKGEKKEIDPALQKLFSNEAEVDTLRRAIFGELAKSDLSLKYREDLKGLIQHLDILADHVKDSARSISILIDTSVPKEISDGCVVLAKNLTNCATTLGECIEMLGIGPYKTGELADQVDNYEDKADDLYLTMKSQFIRYSKDLDVATLMELQDLLHHMEFAADICADTADHLRTLSVGV
jgi:predicted phosphate transport protein (TIGR00153 family)